MRVGAPDFSLTRTFNSFTKMAVKDFPELAGKFGIYHAPTDTLYGHFDPDQKEYLLEIARKQKEKDRGRTIRAVAIPPSAYGNDSYYLTNIYADDATIAPLLRTLKHELGHLIAPSGNDQRHGYNFGECVAETFSLLYQQQTSSLQDQIEKAKYASSIRLIQVGDISNFHLPVLLALEKLSTSYDLPGMHLTPQQSANLAYRLSLQHAPLEGELQTLGEIFKPVKQLLEKPDGNGYTTCAVTMLTDHGDISPLLFTAGRAHLEPLLNKREDIVTEWESDDFCFFDGAFWDCIREKIKDRTLKGEARTFEQDLAQEAEDMMIFGRFDKDPDSLIDPVVYESEENLAYLDRAMEAYVAIRHLQETGWPLPGPMLKKADVDALDEKQTIDLACGIADKALAKKNRTSSPRTRGM